MMMSAGTVRPFASARAFEPGMNNALRRGRAVRPSAVAVIAVQPVPVPAVQPLAASSRDAIAAAAVSFGQRSRTARI